jgi:hypothetical protein
MDASAKFEVALKHENHRNIDGEKLWRKLIFISDLLEKSMCPLDIPKFLENIHFILLLMLHIEFC